MIKYPDIEQFRHIVSEMNKYCEKRNIDLPTVNVDCTIKLHGTNGGVVYENGEIYVQSRRNKITLQKDNAGFATFVEERKDVFQRFFNTIMEENNLQKESTITIFGEFVGKGIQKGVGISLIDKSYFIFGVKIIYDGIEKWVSFDSLEEPTSNIFNIRKFKHYNITCDFKHPEIANNVFKDIVDEVEKRCPVADRFLPQEKELIGEGIVCTFDFGGRRWMFKCKGEKHSKSKVKKMRKLTEEEIKKLNKIDQCVEEIFSPQRCNQFLTELFGVDFEKNIDIKKMGEYLKMISKDVRKEEYDILEKYGLKYKDISRKLNTKNKKYFMEIYKRVNDERDS